jgi:hypothetical protein
MKNENFLFCLLEENSVKSDFSVSNAFLSLSLQRPREGAQLILINSLDAKEKRQRERERKSEKLIFRRKQILRFFFMSFSFLQMHARNVSHLM